MSFLPVQERSPLDSLPLLQLAIAAPFGAFLRYGILRHSIVDKELTELPRSKRSKMRQDNRFFCNNSCDVGGTDYLDTGGYDL
jgi:hypothetical protein